MSAVYDLEFSKRVVNKFLESVPRGWQFLQKEFPNLNQSRVVFIFQRYQKRWYTLKRCLKVAERLLSSPWYCEKPDLILLNIFIGSEYFGKKAPNYLNKRIVNKAIHNQLLQENHR